MNLSDNITEILLNILYLFNEKKSFSFEIAYFNVLIKGYNPRLNHVN